MLEKESSGGHVSIEERERSACVHNQVVLDHVVRFFGKFGENGVTARPIHKVVLNAQILHTVHRDCPIECHVN